VNKKVTITELLFRNAVDLVRLARIANNDGEPYDEVRWSIAAHLMSALALEGLANEIGEANYDKWTWERLEKADTPLKVRFLSGLGGRRPFDPSREPLQFISELKRTRDWIAHPKPLNPGDEIIVRSKAREISRNVSEDTKMMDGNTIFLGLGKLLDLFSFKKAATATLKAISAMRGLRDHLGLPRFDWLDALEHELKQVTSDAA
jgi:hypothetical protein